jgi:hypothetical protein
VCLVKMEWVAESTFSFKCSYGARIWKEVIGRCNVNHPPLKIKIKKKKKGGGGGGGGDCIALELCSIMYFPYQPLL